MKKKIKVSTAIPASMSGFLSTENPHLTTASLKVFHSGQTGDGRLFTQAFADKIAATIGGTPVVARYDEDTDDFEGHADIQSVFGFVPEVPNLETELDEHGNTWLVTEVRLFTERHDVGLIAKKIVGRSQSLELDPNSLKVEFIYDDKDDLETIQFHDGNLIGLSVLGKEQTPAYRGSGFFSEAIKADEIEELIRKYNTIPTSVVMETGGESMSEEVKKVIDDQVVTKKVTDLANHNPATDDPALREDGSLPADLWPPTKDEHGNLVNGDGHLVDADGKLYGADGKPTETGIVPEALVTLIPGEPVEAANIETEEEEVVETTEETPEVTEEATTEGTPAETPEGDDAGASETGFEEESVKKEDEAEGDDFESDKELPVEEKKEEGMEPQAEESSANATALNNAEREELENYRRADKIGIIASYEEFLSTEDLQEFRDNVDAFAVEELDKELSFKAMQALRNKNEGKPTFAFNMGARQTATSDDTALAIEKYNNRGEQ